MSKREYRPVWRRGKGREIIFWRNKATVWPHTTHVETHRLESASDGVSPAQRSDEEARRSKFFGGTKLPISLKTKGRVKTNGGTKLPFGLT
jgi:hypothetical protein